MLLSARWLSTGAQAESLSETVLRSGNFRTLGEAVEAWSRSGGTLVVTADHTERAPITMKCLPGRAYRLTSDGARTISYAGPHYHWLFCAYSEGRNPFVVDGDLTFDGRNNCSIPFFARFENVGGNDRRDFAVSGLTARNARMKKGTNAIDGAPANAYGATGMLFMGGFDHLVLRQVRAFDVSREAGAGLRGSQGCVGIGVVAILETTRSAKHVLIEDFEVTNVDSDDPPGSEARESMDGVLVFQSAEAAGTRPLIQRGVIREAAGRAIKVYAPGGGGTTRDLRVYRSVHGSAGGSNDIAHQHGDGLIENVDIYYSGNANSQPGIPVGMSSGSARDQRFPFATGIVRDIRIHDTTGREKYAVVTVYYNVSDPSPRSYQVSGVSDTGSARYLLMAGALGAYGPAEIVLDDVSVDLNTAIYASEDRGRGLRIRARGLTNRNRTPVPVQVFYDGRRAPPRYGAEWVADTTVRGVDG